MNPIELKGQHAAVPGTPAARDRGLRALSGQTPVWMLEFQCEARRLATRPKLAAEFVRMGARYVSTGTDLAFLLAESTARARQVHEMEIK